MIKVDGMWSFFAAWDLKGQMLDRMWACGYGGFGAHGQSGHRASAHRRRALRGALSRCRVTEQEAKQA